VTRRDCSRTRPNKPRAFWPVTDNCYIKNRPSQQLATKKLNGQNLLVGHNANEGGLFVPPLTTEADLVDWLQTGQFQNLTPAQIATILAANPNSAVTGTTGPLFETNGLSGLTAVQVAQDADGQKQRGNNIYAEAVFACPAYWLAEGYTRASSSAWLYQYSVPFAFHGSDVGAYFGPNMPNHSADLVLAFRRIWGNFVRTGNPSITASVANGGASANPHAPHPATSWPAWNDAAPQLMNLNTTGGVPYDSQLLWGPVVTQFADPGLVNAISLAPVAQWEGGRKGRCDVYRGLAESIPL
jgi:carboxylesterase type B